MTDVLPGAGVVLLNLGGVRPGGELAPEGIDPVADRGGGRVANRRGQLGDPREAPSVGGPKHGRDRPLAVVSAEHIGRASAGDRGEVRRRHGQTADLMSGSSGDELLDGVEARRGATAEDQACAHRRWRRPHRAWRCTKVPPDETFPLRGSSASTMSVETSARSAPPITRSRLPLVAAVAPWRGLGSRSDEVAAFGGPVRACALEAGGGSRVCLRPAGEESPGGQHDQPADQRDQDHEPQQAAPAGAADTPTRTLPPRHRRFCLHFGQARNIPSNPRPVDPREEAFRSLSCTGWDL